MNEPVLFGIGGIILLIAIAGIAVYGVMYSKTQRRDQIGERFPESDDRDAKPGTRV